MQERDQAERLDFGFFFCFLLVGLSGIRLYTGGTGLKMGD